MCGSAALINDIDYAAAPMLQSRPHAQSSLPPYLPAVSPAGHHTLQRQRFTGKRCIGNGLLHDNTRCIGNVARAPVLRGRGGVVAEIEKGQAGGEGGWALVSDMKRDAGGSGGTHKKRKETKNRKIEVLWIVTERADAL